MTRLSDTLKEMGVEFTFPIMITNAMGHPTYFENSDGYWRKHEYDSEGNETYYENSRGYWCKIEYDTAGNQTYFEHSDAARQEHRHQPRHLKARLLK